MEEVPTAIYHLLENSNPLGKYSLVEYTLKNTSEKQAYRLMVSTQIGDYSDVQTETINLTPGEEIRVYHTPPLPPEKLAKLETTQTAELDLELSLLAVLFASVLLRAGIDPIVTVAPDRAFLGWRVWPGEDRYDLLDTTKLGTEDFEIALKAGFEQAQTYGINMDLVKLDSAQSVETKYDGNFYLDVRALKEEYQIRDIPLD